MADQVKSYSLFQADHGWTCHTKHYDHGMTGAVVAAKSIRQAYYLVNNRVWFNGSVGILSMTNHKFYGTSEGWTHFKGPDSDSPLLPWWTTAKPISQKRLGELRAMRLN